MKAEGDRNLDTAREQDRQWRGASRRPAEVIAPARCAHLRVDPRGYPIIAVIPQHPGREDYGSLSEQRKLVLATFDLCAVCATPLRDELRWQVTFDDELQHMGEQPRFSEAPVHEVCALYAAQVCPFVSSPYARLGDPMRKGQRRPDTLVIAGFDRTAEVVGHDSELQVGEGILMFEMAGLGRTHRLVGADDARAAYEAALGDDAPMVLDDAERRLIDILCAPTPEGEDAGGVMAGAAWLIGAAFCPQIRRVQAMKRFAQARDDFYFQVAANALLQPDLMQDWESIDDPCIAAASSWLRTRQRLPAVLEQWQRDGARRVRDVNGRRPRIATTAGAPPRDDAAIRRRKAAEAALRKGRRKKR
ncbi:hypothetical protein GCM10010124_31800 [Pilimelia terevasa]|uniref:Uncharacterized protein n=1 Tax=Pilimelia terevasa TaxID=53372 RepID=A0A8J3FL22_9ACTN|nr:hypothetical protein [Pilimelia terevasa]GGK36784.1 hypothetical protein GCM10010124_31800 [Pilimelia terevasa]